MIKPLELFLAGGGSKNSFLCQEIVNSCKGIKVSSIEQLGMPVEAREAIAFALLAWWNLLKKPASSKASTGISRPAVLGIAVTPY